MTGIGLAVAIPAVVAYNLFTRGNRVLLARLDAFAFELLSFLTMGQTLRQGVEQQLQGDGLRVVPAAAQV